MSLYEKIKKSAKILLPIISSIYTGCMARPIVIVEPTKVTVTAPIELKEKRQISQVFYAIIGSEKFVASCKSPLEECIERYGFRKVEDEETIEKMQLVAEDITAKINDSELTIKMGGEIEITYNRGVCGLARYDKKENKYVPTGEPVACVKNTPEKSSFPTPTTSTSSVKQKERCEPCTCKPCKRPRSGKDKHPW